MASSGESNGNSDYVDSHENLPTILTNITELKGHIYELQKMYEVAEVNIEDFSQPTELFTQPDKVDPTEIANDDTTPAETYQDNGTMPTHGTQPSSPHSPLTYASVDLEPPLLRPCVDDGAVACLASTTELPKVRLKAANDVLFSVYQDWLHHNPVTHLDGGIN